MKDLILTYKSSVSLKCVLVANVGFWVISFIGLCADSLVASNRSRWLTMAKIRPTKFISGNDRRDLIMLTAFNMLLVAPLISVSFFEMLWDRRNGEHRLTEEDEWVWQTELLEKVPIHFIVTELGFYVVHIFLHSQPILYKHVHKVHHRFQAPTAMACVYAHPLEFLVGNLFPIFLGPILTNAHPFTCYVWFAAAMTSTCKGHSGYRIFGHADYHEEHHLLYNYNYGGMYVLDTLFGTRSDVLRRNI